MTATATPTATATAVTVSGVAIQNAMNGASVTALSVNSNGSDGSTLASTTANGSGQFSMVIAAQSGPVRFRASGGSYVSEQNGATISSPSPLSALLPSLQNNLSGVSINPLTTFVDSLAQGNISRGQTVAAALNNSTTSIEQDYGISTDLSTLTPLYTSGAVGTDAFRLGLILGAMVNEDQLACPSAPGGLVSALSSDISDGVFDGASSGTPVSYCGGNLAAIAGIAQFGDALSGLQDLTLATSGFVFGGTNNELTLNGVTAANAFADAATIEAALSSAAPASVNSFAATTPSMRAARESATATLLPNGKVLIAGGLTTNDLTSTELYDPVAGTFAASTPSMNTARDSATATLLPNGKVLIAGGFTGDANTALTSTELYDPVANTFAAAVSTPVMNVPRTYAAATLLPNGKVLIAGGYNFPTGALISTELYDPVANTFAISPPSMNGARYNATATLLPNGKVLIAGGFNNTVTALNTTELYDPVSNTFAASTPTMNFARTQATAMLLPSGKVLIAGGADASANSIIEAELYDPATNTFASKLAFMNEGREEATATLLPNGKVLIAGGLDFNSSTSTDAVLSSIELYDPATNLFAPSPPSMNTARDLATATLLPNGKVLIAGGAEAPAPFPNYQSTTELYSP